MPMTKKTNPIYRNFIGTNQKIYWTEHAKAKMRFYKLSEQRIKRVLNSPKRTEEGIAPNTAAMMQPALIKTISAGKHDSTSKHFWNQEIWVMVQKKNKTPKIKVISAWRYPGMTKPGDSLPEEILNELRMII